MRRGRPGWVTLLLCVLGLVLTFAGEIVGFVVGEVAGLDVEVATVVGGALAGVLALAAVGGWSLIRPTRAAVGHSLRMGWWVVAVSLLLCVLDFVGLVADGSFVLVEDWPYRVLDAMLLCIAVGISEEAMFRGLLLGGLTDVLGRTKRGLVAAVCIASLLFGIAHIDFELWGEFDVLVFGQAVLKVLQTGIFGLYLAAETLESRSIVGPALLHGLSDFLLLFTSMGLMGESADVEYVTLDPGDAVVTMGIYLLVIALYVPLLVKAVRMLRAHRVPDHGALHK